MLAKVFDPDQEEKVRHWWQSEKLDGVRGTISRQHFLSRSGKEFTVPKHYKQIASKLPKGIVLDGEWYGGLRSFHKTSGTLRRKTIIESEWQNIHFYAFDMYSPTLKELPFRERYVLLEKTVKELGTIKLVKQYKGLSHKLYKQWINKGGEGAMLRDAESKYEFKRSKHLLKWKPFFDTEGTVIGYVEGKGKYKGKLGAFMVKDGKKTFMCSGRLTDSFRSRYVFKHGQMVGKWKKDGIHPQVGDRVTYSYMEKIDGMPRQPIFLRMR